jgi:hypothetical protein
MRFLVAILAIASMLFANYEVSTQGRFAKDIRKANLKHIITPDTYTSFVKLQNTSSKLAIIRGDILSNINNGANGFRKYTNYTVLAKMSDSVFYLISKNSINSIYDLRNKTVAIGSNGNIAGRYLMNIAKKAGVSSEINVKAIEEVKAIEALKNSQVDAIFVIASRYYHNIVTKNGLRPTNIPNDFLKTLSLQSGFIQVKNKGITTIKSDNYLIASNELIYEDIEYIANGLKNAGIIPLNNINSTFGSINPYINEVLSKTPDLQSEAKKISKKSKPTKKYTNNKKRESFEYKIIESSKDSKSQRLVYYKTNAFDKYPYKARHFFDVSPKRLKISPNSTKILTIDFNKVYQIDGVSGAIVYKNIDGTIKEINFKVGE